MERANMAMIRRWMMSIGRIIRWLQAKGYEWWEKMGNCGIGWEGRYFARFPFATSTIIAINASPSPNPLLNNAKYNSLVLEESC
jgi:hypothetical protein